MWTKAALVFLGIALMAAYYKLKPSADLEPVTVQHENKPHVEYADESEVHIPEKRSRPSQPQKFLNSYSLENETFHLDLAPEWEDELFVILQQVDAEHAEDIFNKYKNEKARHEEDLNLNISTDLDNLSMLNGESINQDFIPEEKKRSADFRLMEINLQRRIRIILGDHAEYIHQQYQLHQQLNQ